MWIVAVGTKRRLLVTGFDQCRVNTVIVLGGLFLVTVTAGLAHAQRELPLALDGGLDLAVRFRVQIRMAVLAVRLFVHGLGIRLGCSFVCTKRQTCGRYDSEYECF